MEMMRIGAVWSWGKGSMRGVSGEGTRRRRRIRDKEEETGNNQKDVDQ